MYIGDDAYKSVDEDEVEGLLSDVEMKEEDREEGGDTLQEDGADFETDTVDTHVDPAITGNLPDAGIPSICSDTENLSRLE